MPDLGSNEETEIAMETCEQNLQTDNNLLNLDDHDNVEQQMPQVCILSYSKAKIGYQRARLVRNR